MMLPYILYWGYILYSEILQEIRIYSKSRTFPAALWAESHAKKGAMEVWQPLLQSLGCRVMLHHFQVKEMELCYLECRTFFSVIHKVIVFSSRVISKPEVPLKNPHRKSQIPIFIRGHSGSKLCLDCFEWNYNRSVFFFTIGNLLLGGFPQAHPFLSLSRTYFLAEHQLKSSFFGETLGSTTSYIYFLIAASVPIATPQQ